MTTHRPTRHSILQPANMPESVGYAHAVVPCEGTTLYVGGQGPIGPNGRVVAGGLLEQFDAAAKNVVRVLAEAGAEPSDLVAMWIYVTDGDQYRSWRFDLGRIYRQHFGRHYVASGVFVVDELWEPRSLVELVCTAVIPDP